MIIGIGCDCVELLRFKEAVTRTNGALLERLFTPEEIRAFERYSDPISRFAGRFAAKEALSKALGCGIGSSLHWHDMSIVNDVKGRPIVQWRDEVISRFDIATTHLSISHSETMAMAYALIESPYN